jgi:hypothetical protein
MMSLLDALSMLRRFRGYLAGAGGVGDMVNALRWSAWYAVKWWLEARDAGMADRPVAKALYRSLLHHGYIDEGGRPVKRVEQPKRPRGPYAQEWLALHEAFDRAFPKILRGDVEAGRLVAESMQAQGWYKLWRDDFLEAAGFEGKRVLEAPLSAHSAVDIYSSRSPELYVGYAGSDEAVEDLLEVSSAVSVGQCPGSGICVFVAPSACEVADALGQLTPREVLLFNSLHWMPDPAKEVACLKRAAPGALFYVGQAVVETMPGFLAITAAAGAIHTFSRSEVEAALEAAGLRRRKLLLREMPFYAAVWSP